MCAFRLSKPRHNFKHPKENKTKFQYNLPIKAGVKMRWSSPAQNRPHKQMQTAHHSILALMFSRLLGMAPSQDKEVGKCSHPHGWV